MHPEPPAEPSDDTRTARPRRPGRRAVSIVNRVGLVLLSLVAIVLATQPLWLGQAMGHFLTRDAGREVHFDSVRIGLTGSLEPVVVMRGVRIANAPWADTTVPFAALEEVAFRFSWRRFEDRWVVSHLFIRDGEVHLARRADGLRNWRLRDPEDRGPGHYWFLAMEPRRASLSLANEGVELDLHTRSSELPAGTPASSTGDPVTQQVDFDGRFRGVAFKGSAQGGPVITFVGTDRWFAIRGHAEVDGARVEMDGHVADLFRGTRFEVQASLRGRSLAALRPIVGVHYAVAKDFRAQGRASGESGRYRFEQASIRLGASDFAGDLAWSSADDRRSLKASLRSDATDLDDLLWLVGRGAPALARAGKAVQADLARTPGHDPFVGARGLDADIAFAAKRFHVAAAPMVQSLQVKATLADARLAVSSLDLGWGGGHATGTVALDLREPVAAAEAHLETHGIRVETLMPAQEAKRRITGALRGRLDLKSRGSDLDALRAAAGGSMAISLTDGTIPSLLDAQMGLAGGKLLRTMLSGNEALALTCANLAVDVSGGRAQVRRLVVDSANTRTTGTGTIDLRDGVIDVVLTPEAKKPGLFELQKSIRFSGKLPRPERALVDRASPPATTACTAK